MTDFDRIALQNAERQKRKDELAAGTPFQTRLFTTVANDPTCTSSVLLGCDAFNG